MSVIFNCQHCQATMQSTPDAVGMKCVCVSCGKTTIIKPATPNDPPKPTTAAQTSSAETKPKKIANVLSIACPRCKHVLEYARALVGTKGLCRQCHELFVLPPSGQSAVILKRPPSSIAFECPKCLQLFEGTNDQVGRKGKCTNCSTVFSIVAIEPKNLAPATDTKTKSSESKAEIATSPLKQPVAKPKPPQPTASEEVLEAEIIEDAIIIEEDDNAFASNSAPSVPSNLGYTTPSHPAWNTNPYSVPSIPSQNAQSNWGMAGDDPFANIDLSQGGMPLEPQSQFASRRAIGIGELFKKTTDCLFPTVFYMYLPMFAYIIIVGATYALLFVVISITGGLAALGKAAGGGAGEASAGGSFLGVLILIVMLLIVFGGLIGSIIYLFPSFYYMAIRAARGKRVSSVEIDVPGEIRISFFGYLIVQNLILFPLGLVGYLPLVVVSALSLATPFAVLAVPFAFAFLVYAGYVQMNIFTLGAIAVADNRTVGEAIARTFRCIGNRPKLFFLSLLIDCVPIMLISATGIGFLVFGFQYICIRNAVFYLMALKANRTY